ncbi:hypothetical protein KO481_34320 [Nocardia sp. NEAU-G5]|uniref:Uncharacterized protein n=1 Tax=Nocardia albiluteola TaxID=2842303 RepID=A0ABS6BAZ7_9NOCA|nr:hypothetical protein [Nocardia albiluteola]MBU3066580.1 hypothetical protein [Nocardia albiluteola]
MSTKVSSALAALAIVISVLALAPAASAAPAVPTASPVGSAFFCFNIPLGAFSFSICI